MKKFVINLERRSDRKEQFGKTNPNIDVSFFNAIDGKTISHNKILQLGFDTNKTWRDPFFNKKMTKGEVACFMSHFLLWKHCLEINEPILIFEDDAIINDSFNESYYESLMGRIDFLYLGRNENEPENVIDVDDNLEIPGYAYNMHAYAISPFGAKKLLSTNIKTNIIPVDDYVALMKRSINVFALKQDVADQHSRSFLGTDVEQTNDDDYFIDFTTHPITVGTDRKRCTPVNDSAAYHNIYPKNLGTNVDWFNDMSGPAGGKKITLLKKYINNLPDHDVILFTDAYDVFYAEKLETITQRYLSFRKNAVFSAERYCYPDQSLANQYPYSNTQYRFLNSGTFITTVGELKNILSNEVDDNDDDQLYYTKEFLSGNHDMTLDYEQYIFITHEETARKEGNQLFNPLTDTYSCIYHGNGGQDSKQKFDSLYWDFYPNGPSLFIPTYGKYDIIDKDMLVVDFMTQSQCEDLIARADKHGGWGSLSYDKFPAQEIRMKELGLRDELQRHWEKHIYPVIEHYWHPIQMYGLRSSFVMRYAMDTQTSLANHHDASLVTGSVKLNDDYEGADLIFHRQGISNKDIPVGRCILFPGMVTHGHECMPLRSGVKYSLTMWSQRYEGDIID
jgi:GR25 family glycosyltransferase involved in LPS biosynthesis